MRRRLLAWATSVRVLKVRYAHRPQVPLLVLQRPSTSSQRRLNLFGRRTRRRKKPRTWRGEVRARGGSAWAKGLDHLGRRERGVDGDVELVPEHFGARGDELRHEHHDQPVRRIDPEGGARGATPAVFSRRNGD